jgi:hypothetical protein
MHDLLWVMSCRPSPDSSWLRERRPLCAPAPRRW